MIHTLKTCLCLLALTLSTGASTLGSGQSLEADPRLERWQRLDEQERDVLRRRFELLRSMEPERRAELRERLEKLKQMQEELRAEEGDWEPVEGLAEDQRDRAWVDHVHDRLRERGRRMRHVVPPFVQRRLAEAPPHQRRAMLQGLRRGLVRRFGPRLMDEVADRLELPAEEVERLEALPVDERLAELRRLAEERRRERRADGWAPRQDEARPGRGPRPGPLGPPRGRPGQDRPFSDRPSPDRRTERPPREEGEPQARPPGRRRDDGRRRRE